VPEKEPPPSTAVRSRDDFVPSKTKPVMVVAAGPDAGRTVQLADAPLLVGTSPECMLRLSDPAVSRKHAEVRAGDGGVDVRDLGSTNGTYYNGSRIVAAHVPIGGTLCLGDTRIAIALSHDWIDLKPHASASFGPLIGVSLAMRRLFAIVDRVAATDVTVLILGETGTGKDAIAREIHARSDRGDRPFTVVDCAAVAPTLIESELFGHEKGAFTGAAARHKGAFERSDGGTVFLDEVGELPLELQPKLLRVLEDRTVQRVGGQERLPVDVRFLAATHKNLPALVRAEKFRADLYYRLSVAELRVPALRERPEDVPALVFHLVEKSTKKGQQSLEPSPETLARLQHYDWPGNVRELRNLVEKAVAFRDERLLAAGLAADRLPVHVPAQVSQLPYKEAKRLVLDAFERTYLVALLERCGHNVSQAARQAEMDRSHLAELIERHGLAPK
jgi:transcriptional regulator with GAF, ATPase, and Fis domain